VENRPDQRSRWLSRPFRSLGKPGPRGSFRSLCGRGPGLRAGALMAALAMVAATLAACSATPATSVSPATSGSAGEIDLPGPDHPAWLLARSVLAQLVLDPAAVSELSGKLVYELLPPGVPPLPRVVAEPVVDFASAAALESAVNAGQIPSGTFGVLYDPEAWVFTPLAEQQNPVQAAKAAAAVAHAHGLRLIVTPAIDLAGVLDPSGTGPEWRQFLDLDLVGRLAKVADVVELQAQSLEQDTRVYTAFVQAAAAQANAARPGVDLLGGLSTNPPGVAIDAAELMADIPATRPVVDGYWLNVPAPGPQCPACHAAQPAVAAQVLALTPLTSAGFPAEVTVSRLLCAPGCG
jgi:hypothetical protein